MGCVHSHMAAGKVQRMRAQAKPDREERTSVERSRAFDEYGDSWASASNSSNSNSNSNPSSNATSNANMVINENANSANGAYTSRCEGGGIDIGGGGGGRNYRGTENDKSRRESQVLLRATALDRQHEEALRPPALREITAVRMGAASQRLLRSFEEKERDAHAIPTSQPPVVVKTLPPSSPEPAASDTAQLGQHMDADEAEKEKGLKKEKEEGLEKKKGLEKVMEGPGLADTQELADKSDKGKTSTSHQKPVVLGDGHTAFSNTAYKPVVAAS